MNKNKIYKDYAGDEKIDLKELKRQIKFHLDPMEIFNKPRRIKYGLLQLLQKMLYHEDEKIDYFKNDLAQTMSTRKRTLEEKENLTRLAEECFTEVEEVLYDWAEKNHKEIERWRRR